MCSKSQVRGKRDRINIIAPQFGIMAKVESDQS